MIIMSYEMRFVWRVLKIKEGTLNVCKKCQGCICKSDSFKIWCYAKTKRYEIKEMGVTCIMHFKRGSICRTFRKTAWKSVKRHIQCSWSFLRIPCSKGETSLQERKKMKEIGRERERQGGEGGKVARAEKVVFDDIVGSFFRKLLSSR